MARRAAAEEYPAIRTDENDERQRFFEQMLAGSFTEQEIWNRADQLNLELRAGCYAIAVMSAIAEPGCEAGAFDRPAVKIRDGVISYFLKYPEYAILSRDFVAYTVLIMSDEARIGECIRRCIDTVRELYETHDPDRRWHLAVGSPTGQVTGLAACFEEAQRLWAYRYILPEQNVLLRETVDSLTGTGSGSALENADEIRPDPADIAALLKDADPAEIAAFGDSCVDGQREALKSRPYCHYLMLSVRFGAADFVQSLGISRQEFLAGLPCLDMVGRSVTAGELKRYISEIMLRALEIRDGDGSAKYSDPVKRAVNYIDACFCREDICLNQIAREAGVSPNYLSAVFSREMGQTLVDYLTAKRMEKARDLLRSTNLRSGQIAGAVGYKDPRYFSALFRKIHGCSPKEYRAGN